MSLQFTKEDQHLLKVTTDKYAKEYNQNNFVLEDAIGRWRTFVAQIDEGYRLSIYDYTNGLSRRMALGRFAELLHEPSLKDRLMDILSTTDAVFRSLTTPTDLPLYGTPESYADLPWWYHRIPLKLSGELKEDVESLAGMREH